MKKTAILASLVLDFPFLPFFPLVFDVCFLLSAMPVPSDMPYTMSAGASPSSFSPMPLSFANAVACAPCAAAISLMASGESANECARELP